METKRVKCGVCEDTGTYLAQNDEIDFDSGCVRWYLTRAICTLCSAFEDDLKDTETLIDSVGKG